MKKCRLFSVMMAAALMLTAPAAFAEGSRNLVGQDVQQTDGSYTYQKYTSYYRPYLVYGSCTNAGQKMLTVIYAYAEKGETINFGTNVVYDSQYAPYGLKGEKNDDGTGGINISWHFARNMMEIVNCDNAGAIGWRDDQWRKSENPDKFATIAVSICNNDNYKAYPTARSGDFKKGSDIANATQADVGKTVYLFTADSAEPTQIKDEYEDIEKGYIALSSGKPSQVNGLTEPIDKSRSYLEGKIGYISNPDEEEKGPNGVIPYNGSTPTTDGYTPLSFVAPMTGTYAFRFMTNNEAYNGNALPIKLSDETNETDLHSYKQHAPHIAMWDVTVSAAEPTAAPAAEASAASVDESSTEPGTESSTAPAAEPSAAPAAVQRAKSGRVWADVLNLNMGSGAGTLGSNVYVLTRDGFVYQVNFNGMRPFGFSFFSNNRGFLLEDNSGNTQSLNHSYYSRRFGLDGVGRAPFKTTLDAANNEWKTSILPNTVPSSEKDFNHRIFFNRPDEVAAKAYTGDIGVRSTVSTPTQQYSMEYIGDGSNSYNGNDRTTTITVTDENNQPQQTTVPYHSGTEGIGGHFKVHVPASAMNVTASNTFSIKLDFSGYELDENTNKPTRTTGGEWQKVSATAQASDEELSNVVILSSNNFKLNDAKTEYVCEILWDGRDAYDNVVPPGIYAQVITSYWQAGTAHFPLLDVEYNPKGIKMKMLNEIESTADARNGESDTIYYNNSGTSGSGSSAWYFSECLVENKPGNKDNENVAYHPATDNNIPLLGKDGETKNALNGVRTYFDDPTKDGAIMSDTVMVQYPNRVKIPNDHKAEAPGDHTAIDIWMRYATPEQRAVMAIGVNPRTEDRKPATPYVSFVGETREDKLPVPTTKPGSTTPLELGTHVGHFDKVKYDGSDQHFASGTWKYEEFKNDIGSASGVNYFGNTVSTEFVANITPDIYTYDKVRWTINIPTDSTYVKAEATEGHLNLVGLTINLGEKMLADTGAENGAKVSAAEEDYNNAALAVDMENAEKDEASGEIGDEFSDNTQLNNTDADNGIFFEEDNYEDFTAGEDIPTFGFFEDNAELAASQRTIGPPKVNKGCIFRVTGFQTGTANTASDYGTLRFRYKLPTQITGSLNVIYGLVIDNLYAPKATASEIRFEPTKVEDDKNYFELNDKNSVSSTTNAAGYYENEKNEYWKVDPNNPKASQAPLGQETTSE